jgi:putative ABC transport system substrate-binding protein
MIKRGVTLVVVAILALGILGTPVVAAAQQARKVARVGVLGTALQSQNLEALRKGLREFGWIESQNLLLEIRLFEGQSAPLGALATELVDLKVDLIFTADSAAAHAARNATGTVPIVGASLGDAVRSGLIASLARPGGNVTGLSLQTEELTGKWFELLKEALPSMTRVAILHHSRTGTTPMKDFEAAARSLGLAPLPLSVQAAPDFKAAFQAANRGRAQGLVLGSSPLFGEHVGELAALALP